MNIYLLNEQIDLVLNSLEYYLYTYNYFYPRKRISLNKEDNLKVSLIRDTYEQISYQALAENRSKIGVTENIKIS